ncbi:ABC transporter permease [Porphyromonas gingivalis]|uniref:ABC transporter permease n=1 Tax=Porphyromonas gingivalis TaxID=837 RepID=UPI0024DFF48D|nr:ABC transporter permease [Porphyromonas gingivalis]WIM90512.1 ABC transporter permease [Porphyromonas gingivalis]
MNNINTIIQREYMIRVRKKSFLVMTILMPILFVGLVSLPIVLAQLGGDMKTIAIADRTGEYEQLFKENDEFRFVHAEKTAEEYRKMGADKSGIDAVLEIRQDLLEDPNAVAIYAYKQLPASVSNHISRILSDYLSDKKIASYNIPDIKQILADSKIELSVHTYKWSEDGTNERTSGELASGISMMMMVVIFFLIMTLAAMVQAGVLEEKKNRIMEVMVSSTRPFDLMMGKIIGIGLVGLTQLICWGVLTVLLLTVAQIAFLGNLYSPEALSRMQASDITGMASSMNAEDFAEMKEVMNIIGGINFGELFVMFLIFFIGGYLLYSSIFAVIGSMVSNDEDTSQFMMPVMILLMFGFYAAYGSMNNPEGSLAFWCSLIPFTSPLVMMVRLPYDVPLWQELLSIGLLYGCFVLMTWIGAKIYRVGVLMYGKKPSIKEIIRWINYK